MCKIYNVFSIDPIKGKRFVGSFSSKLNVYEYIHLDKFTYWNFNNRLVKANRINITTYYRIFESNLDSVIDCFPYRKSQPKNKKFNYPTDFNELEKELMVLRRDCNIDDMLNDDVNS